MRHCVNVCFTRCKIVFSIRCRSSFGVHRAVRSPAGKIEIACLRPQRSRPRKRRWCALIPLIDTFNHPERCTVRYRVVRFDFAVAHRLLLVIVFVTSPKPIPRPHRSRRGRSVFVGATRVPTGDCRATVSVHHRYQWSNRNRNWGRTLV